MGNEREKKLCEPKTPKRFKSDLSTGVPHVSESGKKKNQKTQKVEKIQQK